ncbi:TetR/AcrR family transcriptional regulator [Devosia sp. Root635]|uniref:TetR/AcrR family transcriptional regulator n=1 Tax=Devosia sp. Root635 TaxID=1736575 RepID=UPI0006F3433F|nr:TetR/AcrR family transcriptional regulator [Devosia sp. Root635]KRA45887.1 TetR family transcriptional regulator [Devosia sp. Root635]
MPRVVKHPEVRRGELIAAARALFFEKGYEATSVDEIIGRAGISKGAFYYYFPAKEAVLEALAEQMAREAANETQALVADQTLNGFERLDLFLKHNRRLKVERAPEALALFEALFRPENIALYHHVFTRISRVLIPLVADILQRGMDDGSFLPGDADAMAEILLGLTTTTHDSVAALVGAPSEEAFQVAAAAFQRRWVAQGIVADRILGLPEGSIQFIEPGFAEAFFAGWRLKQAG